MAIAYESDLESALEQEFTELGEAEWEGDPESERFLGALSGLGSLASGLGKLGSVAGSIGKLGSSVGKLGSLAGSVGKLGGAAGRLGKIGGLGRLGAGPSLAEGQVAWAGWEAARSVLDGEAVGLRDWADRSEREGQADHPRWAAWHAHWTSEEHSENQALWVNGEMWQEISPRLAPCAA